MSQYCPRFVSGMARESDPEFYLKPTYWEGVTEARVIANPLDKELVLKIIAEAKRRNISVVGETAEIAQALGIRHAT